MGEADREVDPFECIERSIMHLGWLGQRHFLQLLAEERFGLTIPQFYTLMHLQRCGGTCKMSDLARVTQQSAASLTGIIDRLHEKHLVQRLRPDNDRRQVLVATTGEGVQLLDKIAEARSSAMQLALSNADIAHVDAIQQALDDLIRALHAATQAD
jgi:DNA-binding MarR family transcriptional regulator